MNPTAPAVIVRTGNALLASLGQLTGERAHGGVRMRAKPGKEFNLPRWSCFFPVIDGDARMSWTFKVGAGPNEDGSWTVKDDGTTVVTVHSNIGGNRHNVPEATKFVPDFPCGDLVLEGVDAPAAAADFAGGEDPQGFGGIMDASWYETFGGPEGWIDLHRSTISAFPAVLMTFDTFEPADGVALAQTDQSAVSAGANTKTFKVGYGLHVIVSKTEGDRTRRLEGLQIMGDIITELSELHAGPDGEPLSHPGGVQVRQAMRNPMLAKEVYQKFYVYTVFVSAMVALERCDRRKFHPWLRTAMTVQRAPDDAPATPDQEAPIDLHSGPILIDMTPNQLDLVLDGTFVRASAAYMMQDNGLYDYAANERRMLAAVMDGVYLEPQVVNPQGASSTDLTTWTGTGGTLVLADALQDPLGVDDEADVVQFGAGGAGRLVLAGQVAAVGEPVYVQAFARAALPNAQAKVRLAIHDGVSEQLSPEFIVGGNWQRLRWRVTPQGSPVELRIAPRVDGAANVVGVWGVMFSAVARWGAEWTPNTKAKDQLTFTAEATPAQCLSGRWSIEWSNPVVPSGMTGVGLANPKIVSVGNGVLPDLFTLELYGTPGVGNAAIVARTRGAGVVVNLAGVSWALGSILKFEIDARGELVVHGTNTHDGTYPFARYDQDAAPGDRLVIGDDSAGTSAPTPGYFRRVIGA